MKKLALPLRFTSKFQKNPAKKNILPRFTKDFSYTQHVLISNGPISKTSKVFGFFKQWLVTFSNLRLKFFLPEFF